MNKFLKNIHLLFWGCIPIFLLYSFISKDYVDVNIHDMMFVIATKHLAIFFSLIFFITGLGYYLSYKSDKFKPVTALTIAHVALTFIGLGYIFFISNYSPDLPAKSSEDMMKIYAHEKVNYSLVQYSWFGVFLAQPILFLNLIISIFRK